MNLSVIILAAGQGKRMRSATPKILHALAGRPLLQHVVNTAVSLQPQRVVIVHAPSLQPGQIGITAEASLQWVEQVQALGTGHAVRQALAHLPQNAESHVLVLYGDVPAIRATTLQHMCDQAILGADIVVLTGIVKNPSGLGRIVRGTDGQLSGIVEELDATVDQKAITEINSGLMLFRLALLQQFLPRLQANNAQGEYYLTDVIALAQQQGRSLATVVCEDAKEIQGINDRSQLAQVERYYQKRQAMVLMQQGVTIADPDRFDCRGSLIAGTDVFIDINCVFEGLVQLGQGVRIGPNCIIKDTVMADNVVVHANTMIDGACIDTAASVGPFARIRPGTKIATKAHVGNFVEIKKTYLGAASKASHLAYLGDAMIGERVNIGAGVITCNYDGVNKHVTTIEDDVFVGSDCQLIAPVLIKKGATIGAGSTITQEVPAAGLTLSRVAQKSVAGWQRKKKIDKKGE